MVLSTRVPVYNRQTRSALSTFLRLSACFLFFSFFYFSQAASPSDPLEDATRALARRVASTLHGGIVSVAQQNLSALNGAEFSHLNEVFQEELLGRGVKISQNQGAVKVVFTVAGTIGGYMGVVQIERGDNSTTESEPLGRGADSVSSDAPSAITLHREFLFAQESPLVDVAFSVDRKSAYALGPEEIHLYALKGEQWESAGFEHLPAQLRLSRDLRGFLFLGADTNSAYLPGQLCRSSPAEHKDWTCEIYRELMPVRFVPPGSVTGKKAPWHSAARFEADGAVQVVLTGQDGLARLYTDGSEPVATVPDWGSEISSVKSGCATGWQILATGKNDWAAADTIQAFEIKDHAPRVVSQAVEFNGPVIALHNPSSSNSAETVDARDAVAVVHNLQTGRYEAYRLTVICAE